MTTYRWQVMDFNHVGQTPGYDGFVNPNSQVNGHQRNFPWISFLAPDEASEIFPIPLHYGKIWVKIKSQPLDANNTDWLASDPVLKLDFTILSTP